MKTTVAAFASGCALALAAIAASAQNIETHGDYVTQIDDDGIAAVALARTEPHVQRYLTIPSRKAALWEVRSDAVGANPAPSADDFVFRERYCPGHYIVLPIIVPQRKEDAEIDQPHVLVDLASRRVRLLGEGDDASRPQAVPTPCLNGTAPLARSSSK